MEHLDPSFFLGVSHDFGVEAPADGKKSPSQAPRLQSGEGQRTTVRDSLYTVGQHEGTEGSLHLQNAEGSLQSETSGENQAVFSEEEINDIENEFLRTLNPTIRGHAHLVIVENALSFGGAVIGLFDSVPLLGFVTKSFTFLNCCRKASDQASGSARLVQRFKILKNYFKDTDAKQVFNDLRVGMSEKKDQKALVKDLRRLEYTKVQVEKEYNTFCTKEIKKAKTRSKVGLVVAGLVVGGAVLGAGPIIMGLGTITLLGIAGLGVLKLGRSIAHHKAQHGTGRMKISVMTKLFDIKDTVTGHKKLNKANKALQKRVQLENSPTFQAMLKFRGISPPITTSDFQELKKTGVGRQWLELNKSVTKNAESVARKTDRLAANVLAKSTESLKTREVERTDYSQGGGGAKLGKQIEALEGLSEVVQQTANKVSDFVQEKLGPNLENPDACFDGEFVNQCKHVGIDIQRCLRKARGDPEKLNQYIHQDLVVFMGQKDDTLAAQSRVLDH